MKSKSKRVTHSNKSRRTRKTSTNKSRKNKKTSSRKTSSRKTSSKKSSSKRKSKSPHNLTTTYRLCDTCNDIKIVNGNIMSHNNEQWKHFPHHLPVLGRKNGVLKTTIDLGKEKKNRLVYYFASKDKFTPENLEYPDAYDKSPNNGLVFLDAAGKACVYLDCPQPYKEQGVSYMSHIHLLVSNSKMTQWEDGLITQGILCKITRNKVATHVYNQDHLFINALSADYHNKFHIPTSFNLYYKDAKKMTVGKLVKCVEKMAHAHPHMKKLLKKMTVQELPIIVYCYDKACSAGADLANELFRAGFTNVVDYAGGIIEWMGRNSRPKKCD